MPNVIVAIETSTENCSAALLRDGAVLERSELAPRRHATLILPMIESLLDEAGMSRRELDAVAVGRGPGAFTGVRLAISVAQGLALGLDIPVIPVSSLAALAQDVPPGDASILATIDARMGEVYAGAFRRKSDGLVESLGAESVGPASMLVLPEAAKYTNGQWSVVGSGWNAYHDALSARLPQPPAWADGTRHPQARAIAQLAAPQFASGRGVAPEYALPVYLRDKVALTLDEQRAR
ncbi:MAG TPA: tRNA (adenosine(37)-N6)-threonylcarbamoyltransferase complex dimerization subunit type 1 TsaB [Rudaea sp.]|jgi:tRNA threonylcarbamoyladenosine biosynthesis protein TsaB|nr:tRNA (adenosine(37)-N6)-threonylcarbamoyltransferase complex dimerization subunit type 1 TsaB [Rudaea sp.]